MSRNRSWINRWTVGISLGLMFLIGLIGLAYVAYGARVVSDGEKTGFIIKFTQHRGWVWNTWEGEMALGGSRSGDGAQTNVWSFSVKDDNVLPKIHEAQRKAKPVTLHYQQQLTVQTWKGETSYFVDEVISQQEN